MMLRLWLALMAGFLALEAQAAAWTADGVATGQSQTETIRFGNDHIVLNTRVSYSKVAMQDPAHPMNQLKGSCFGAIEIRGGAAEGGGVCVFDGLEGDRVLLGWNARRVDTQGRIYGYWTVNSGTGLWLSASGGGTFVSDVNQANGTAKNTLKGAVTLR